MYVLLISCSLLFSLAQAQNSVLDYINARLQAQAFFSFAQGGQNWGGLCTSGRSQSPIDIYVPETFSVSDPSFSAISIDIPPQEMTEFDYLIYPLYLANGTLSVVLDGTAYNLMLFELHVHIPAVHPINGLRYALEMHVTFTPSVPIPAFVELTVAFLFQNGPRNPFFDSLLSNDIVDLSSLISTPIEDYFYYSGSRDTPAPDCIENISFVVVPEIFSISVDQLQAIKSGSYARAWASGGYHGVYREPQPLNERTVYHRVPELSIV